MKQINIYFEDKEMKLLRDLKKDSSWHDFILFLAKFRYEHKDE